MQVYVARRDYICKVLVTGGLHSGKTSLISLWSASSLPGYPIMRSEGFVISIQTSPTTIVEGAIVNLLLRRSLSDWTQLSTYFSAKGVVVLFDLTLRSSFDTAVKSLESVPETTRRQAVLMLIGNKCDLTSWREIAFEEAKHVADLRSAVYMEISTKTGINVKEALRTLSGLIILKDGGFL